MPNEGFVIKSWVETFTSIKEQTPILLIMSILAGVINAQIDPNNKARLVFWKWSHPLPGCCAFTKYASADPRINRDALHKYEGPLPTEPDKQNALWFKWYREFQDEPGIKQVHQEYLFTRDYAGISFLLIFFFGSLALWQMRSVKVTGIYLAALIAQYVLVRWAARNHGVRFVTSVLAYKTSSD